MKDLTRWGRDYLQVGNAMEIFRRNNVRFIAVNNGIDSEKPDTLEFAPFINIMSEWYAKDISKKVKTGIKTKGMSGKPIVTEAPYGYVKDPDNKDFWIIDEEAAAVVRLIFRLFIGGKNRNQIAVHLKNEQIPTPTFYMKDRGVGICSFFRCTAIWLRFFPADKQTENQTDNRGGFLVDYPKILVVRVFDIAVRGFGDNRLSVSSALWSLMPVFDFSC